MYFFDDSQDCEGPAAALRTNSGASPAWVVGEIDSFELTLVSDTTRTPEARESFLAAAGTGELSAAGFDVDAKEFIPEAATLDMAGAAPTAIPDILRAPTTGAGWLVR